MIISQSITEHRHFHRFPDPIIWTATTNRWRLNGDRLQEGERRVVCRGIVKEETWEHGSITCPPSVAKERPGSTDRSLAHHLLGGQVLLLLLVVERPPEQHDVRLRPVDRVVNPPPALLHTDGTPLCLWQKPVLGEGKTNVAPAARRRRRNPSPPPARGGENQRRTYTTAAGRGKTGAARSGGERSAGGVNLVFVFVFPPLPADYKWLTNFYFRFNKNY